jgi:putative transposase
VKRSKYMEQQIAFALKQAELGTPVEEVCRKMGISDATFYNRKKKYGGLGPSELRRLKQLEEENVKLKRLLLRPDEVLTGGIFDSGILEEALDAFG